MAGIIGGGGVSKNTPKYTMMNIQTSVQGVVIPICYGQSRVAPNLIWYGGFQAVPAKSSGGKGGGGKGSGSYNYYADVIMAICEGVVTDVVQVFKSQSAQLLSQDGMLLFEGGVGQAPWSYLSTNFPSEALGYSGTAYIAVAQLALGSSPDLPDYSFDVKANLCGTMPDTVDVNPADIIYDYITNAQYGLAPGATWLDPVSLLQYKKYCAGQNILFSPYFSEQEQVTNTFQRWAQITNTFIFWSGNQLKFVPLGAYELTGYGYTYVPQITPIYNLTYDDYIQEHGKEPLTVTRVDPADGYNQVQLDIRDRNNAYNNTSIYWSDQASVNQYGQLMANIVEATEICDQQTANTAASLLGQRSVYVRNTYSFKLAYTYVLLEPGDIITLTEPNIGLNQFPVRVQSVQEDENQILSLVCEEFPASIGVPTSQARQAASAGPTYNANVAPGNINPPAILEPSLALTGGSPEVWLGLSGGEYWGGCQVFLSFDGLNYSQIGIYYTPVPQGTLVNNIPATADPDTTDILTVDLTISDGSLPTTATNADADAFRTLILVDHEIMSYGTVQVGTIADQYELTYLRRGLYGSSVVPHYAHTVPVTLNDTPVNSTNITFTTSPNVGAGMFLPGSPSGIPAGAVITAVAGPVITIDQPTTADIPAGSSVSVDGALLTRIDPTSVFQYQLPAQYVGSKLYFKFPSFNSFGNAAQELSAVPEYTYTPVGTGYAVYAPTALSASPIASGAILNVTPNPASNTTYYEVVYGTTNVLGSATAYPGTFTGTSITVAGLTPGQVYYFWVKAANSSAVSGVSPVASCTAGAAGSGVVVQSGTTATSAATIVGSGGTTITNSGGVATINSDIIILSGTTTLGGITAIDFGTGFTETIAAGGTLDLSGTGLAGLSIIESSETLTGINSIVLQSGGFALTGTSGGTATITNTGSGGGGGGGGALSITDGVNTFATTLLTVGNLDLQSVGGVPNVIQKAYYSSGNSFTLPNPPTNGNLVVCIMSTGGNFGGLSATNFTQLAESNHGDWDVICLAQIFSTGNNYSVSFSDSTDACVMLELEGVTAYQGYTGQVSGSGGAIGITANTLPTYGMIVFHPTASEIEYMSPDPAGADVFSSDSLQGVSSLTATYSGEGTFTFIVAQGSTAEDHTSIIPTVPVLVNGTSSSFQNMRISTGNTLTSVSVSSDTLNINLGALGIEYGGTLYPTIVAGTNINLTPGAGTAASNLTISATGGGGGGGGALTLISTQTVSEATEVDFTELASGYDYIISASEINGSAAASLALQVGTGTGPSWITSGYTYLYFGSASQNQISGQTVIAFCPNGGTIAKDTLTFSTIGGIGSSDIFSCESTMGGYQTKGIGSVALTSQVTAMRILMTSGTVSGTFYLYSITR